MEHDLYVMLEEMNEKLDAIMEELDLEETEDMDDEPVDGPDEEEFDSEEELNESEYEDTPKVKKVEPAFKPMSQPKPQLRPQPRPVPKQPTQDDIDEGNF